MWSRREDPLFNNICTAIMSLECLFLFLFILCLSDMYSLLSSPFLRVILYGEAVEEISASLLAEYNQRKTFSQIEAAGNVKGGAEGVWIDEDNDILISCEPGPYEGMIVLRIGAVDFEEAAAFLDDHIGNIDGVLGESPFECMLFGGGGGGGRVESKERALSKVSLLGEGEKGGEELLSSKQLEECDHCTEKLGLPIMPPPHLLEGNQKGSDMDYLVWQLVDSKLPTGGFAHSNSLEAALHVGLVKRGEVNSLKSYVASAVEHMAGASIPFLMSSCQQWERYFLFLFVFAFAFVCVVYLFLLNH